MVKDWEIVPKQMFSCLGKKFGNQHYFNRMGKKNMQEGAIKTETQSRAEMWL